MQSFYKFIRKFAQKGFFRRRQATIIYRWEGFWRRRKPKGLRRRENSSGRKGERFESEGRNSEGIFAGALK